MTITLSHFFSAKHSLIVLTALFLMPLFWLPSKSSAQDYQEEYRPQFHLSSQNGWIGDPDGPIRFQNKYRVFWWNQAVSDDLVYWEDQGFAMTGDDGSFQYFTGSVLVDINNTLGITPQINPAMVAVYTMHNHSTGYESQGISISQDYDLFHYYNGNPVLPSTSDGFRDPSVFWDEQSNRWIMVIARSWDKVIEFYGSPNLKNWTYLSKFEKEGARLNGWEAPDLIQMPLDSDERNKRWVLVCSMGPNQGQYWVGDFNGTTFTTDAVTNNYLKWGHGIDGVLFDDFENGPYTKWTPTGTAFGTESVWKGTLPGQDEVSGYLGEHVVNSYLGGDGSTGTLVSDNFVINHKFINFLVGGGDNYDGTKVQLIVSGTKVAQSQGRDNEILRWDSWDVRDYQGQTARIEVVDNDTGTWGHILVDDIYFSDARYGTQREHAYWLDWGQDFYAVKSFRDYDNVENRTIWLAWMNNWDYANNIPTSWGGSTAFSVPREVSLVSSTKGYQLIQQPIPELQKLRKDKVELNSVTVSGVVPLTPLFHPTRNTYEIITTFATTPGAEANFGLNLCVKDGKRLIVGYDQATSEVYVNRVNANNVSIPNFNTETRAPIGPTPATLRLHVLVDQLSVEVFANYGQAVLTSLMFPSSDALGIELFSSGGTTTVNKLEAWDLYSIWEEKPPSAAEGWLLFATY